MKRIAIRLGAALLLLVVVVVGGVAVYSDQVVGKAIERAATYALGVETTVGFVRLRVLAAEFSMWRLVIDNPAGFDEPHFLAVDRAHIAVERDTLRDPVVRIPRLEFEGIQVALEKEGRATNYGVITANLGKFESGAAGPPPAAEEPGAQTRFIVDRVVIRNVDAHVEWNELAADQTGIRVTIPEIELEGIGARNAQGVVMSELTGIVLKAILGSIARYGTNLPGAITSGLEAGLGGLTRVGGVMVQGMGKAGVDKVADTIGGTVGDAVRGVGGSAAKSVGEAIGQEASKGLGGLFGGGEKEE